MPEMSILMSSYKVLFFFYQVICFFNALSEYIVVVRCV